MSVQQGKDSGGGTGNESWPPLDEPSDGLDGPRPRPSRLRASKILLGSWPRQGKLN